MLILKYVEDHLILICCILGDIYRDKYQQLLVHLSAQFVK